MNARVHVEDRELRGEALNAQRFGMLADIAAELKENVVFPVNFDVTVTIRNALQKDWMREQLEPLLRLDPLLCARLLRVANSMARRQKQPAIVDLGSALAMLDIGVIRKVATDTSAAQLLRSRDLANFSSWAGLLWERTLSMAASAHVIAKKFTDIDPGQAMFAALCHDMALYYMLYRAVQYPELCSRPVSLKHLVINWHGGLSASLLTSLALPQRIIDAVSCEPVSPLPTPPKTLGEIVHISNMLTGPLLSESAPSASRASLLNDYRSTDAEIEAFRRTLSARSSGKRGDLHSVPVV